MLLQEDAASEAGAASSFIFWVYILGMKVRQVLLAKRSDRFLVASNSEP